jgi:hypothetical protein
MPTDLPPLSASERASLIFNLRTILSIRAECEEDPCITYSDLVNELPFDIAPSDKRFHDLLDQLSVEEYHSGRGLLSVLVVQKDSRLPGPGFFAIARFCGERFDDERKFFELAKQQVLDYYRGERC